MIRRNFLKRLALTAAGVLVAEDVTELLISPRKYWPGCDFGGLESPYLGIDPILMEIDRLLKTHFFRAMVVPKTGEIWYGITSGGH